jgi:hypothetical protein
LVPVNGVNGPKPAGKKFQKKRNKPAVAPKPFKASNGNKSA